MSDIDRAIAEARAAIKEADQTIKSIKKELRA